MKKILLILTLIILTSTFLFARIIIEDLQINTDDLYIFRLNNGDQITGIIEENATGSDGRKYLQINSTIGVSLIYHDEIASVRPYDDIYKHTHRIFLMPTAEPIGKNAFIGNLEVLGLYGGFGITQYFSTTFARTMAPFLYPGQQITELNAKSTVYQRPFNSDVAGHMSIALGANVCWLNDYNKIINYYGSMTFRLKKSGFTTNVFFKQGGQDVYEVEFGNYIYPVFYESGTFGIGLGVDTKISDRHDLFFLGEVWNKDVTNLYETCFSLGWRLVIDKCAMDWGFMLFTRPSVLPYFSFVWTPF